MEGSGPQDDWRGLDPRELEGIRSQDDKTAAYLARLASSCNTFQTALLVRFLRFPVFAVSPAAMAADDEFKAFMAGHVEAPTLAALLAHGSKDFELFTATFRCAASPPLA